MTTPGETNLIETNRDLLISALLIFIGTAWVAVVCCTIPAGQGAGDVGPRAFPLIFGMALGFLSLIMFIRAFRRRMSFDVSNTMIERPYAICGKGQMTATALLLTGGLVIFYGFLLQRIGFVLSTLLVVALTMALCAREKSLLRTAAVSTGITLACWLVFSKVLGIYLATGSWVQFG